MELKKSKIKGSGIYLPKRIMHNTDIEKIVETSDEWIYERTGIRERRVCSTEGGEWPTDMAMHATNDALKSCGLKPNNIDMILFASVTPDQKMPNSASILQRKLGITNQCACLDIAAACSGFVYGLNMANSMIQSGLMKNILVVASEMLSREVDWKDRGSCILFGDACAAVIVGLNETPHDGSEILSCLLAADSTGIEYFLQPYGGAVHPLTIENLQKGDYYMQMKGREMFKVATRTLAENANRVMDMAGLTFDDIHWLIPHQANMRIIETTAKLLGISLEKVIVNIEKYGNTSAATIPLAFHQAISDGRIKRGDLILFDAFGAGLTSGATILRY